MIPLEKHFLDTPISHRGLHWPGVPENSLAAVRAAVAAGYGVEVDVQPSADGVPMVFHDYDLARLTGETGQIRARTADELGRLRLLRTTEPIPTLEAVMEVVGLRVPLLLEIKDQDLALGPGIGPHEEAIAEVLRRHPHASVAVMSFNPHSVAACARLLPETPRGLTTEAFPATDWPNVPDATRERLRAIPDYDRVGASFISHDVDDLDRPRVAELKRAGATILCWTVRSPDAHAKALKISDNVTFEGYDP